MIAVARQHQQSASRWRRSRQGQNVDALLISVLRALVEQLEAAPDHRGLGRSEESAVARWEGDGYHYVEMKLPDPLVAELDVNFHGNLVMIRLDASEVTAVGSNHEG